MIKVTERNHAREQKESIVASLNEENAMIEEDLTEFEMQFEIFLEEPTMDQYVRVRKLVVESENYSPYSVETFEMERCARKHDFEGVMRYFRESFPNLMMSPGVHALLGKVFADQGETEISEFEGNIAAILLYFLLETGDGSYDRPYVVIRISDEYDILEALNKHLKIQSLIDDSENSRMLDCMHCMDTTEIFFDVTVPLSTQPQIEP